MTLGIRIIDCDVGSQVRPDLRTVDALARLQLAAIRRGFRVRLVNASPDLVDLLDLSGLAGLLGLAGPLCREARGQAEQPEEPGGVQEEGDARDPIA